MRKPKSGIYWILILDNDRKTAVSGCKYFVEKKNDPPEIPNVVFGKINSLIITTKIRFKQTEKL